VAEQWVLIPIVVGGVELQVEAVRVGGSEQTSTLDRVRDAVSDAFDRAQTAIVAVAASTVTTIGELGQRAVRPDQVQIKFGIKFSAQGNVIVSGASGEASLEVTLTYNKPPT